MNPFTDSNQQTWDNLLRDYPNYEVLAKQIQATFQGFGKENALELAYRLINGQTPATVIHEFLDCFNASPKGFIYESQAKKLTYSAIQPTLTADQQICKPLIAFLKCWINIILRKSNGIGFSNGDIN